MSVFVIAEAGSCHDGDFCKAQELVDIAQYAGADAVKFQFWSNPDRLADRRRVPEEYRAIYRRYRLHYRWLEWLSEQAAEITRGLKPIEFMATTYLPEDVATVAPFVKRFKVASFEAEDPAFLRAHVPYLEHRQLIISCGMGARIGGGDGITTPASWLVDIKRLHCVSAYPAPAAEMNLAALKRCDGLSDHSRHPWMGALAVAAGAEIIEAHLRLDDTDRENPDYATAFAPAEFAEYVRNVRFAEAAMGDGVKRLQPSEEPMAAYRVRS